MSIIGLALVALGVAIFAVGYPRARAPWRRYEALRAEDENAARYRAWRGGRSAAGDEMTGASVAMAMLRRQARTWAAVATIGAALVIVGFVLVLA